MPWNESKIETTWPDAKRSEYLAGLNKTTSVIQMVTEAAAHEAVVFGVEWDKLHELKFSDDDIRFLDYQHELYQAGKLRPKAGSHTAFFIAMVEKFAGGIPSPGNREIVMRQVVQMLANIVRNGAGKMNVVGQMTKYPFVPTADADEKRRKVLDDLNSIGGEPE